MAKNTKTYSEEQIQEVLDKIPDLGISKAAKSVNPLADSEKVGEGSRIDFCRYR